MNTAAKGASDVLYPKKPDMMSTAEAAAYLDLKEGTLAIWRCTKRYSLTFIRVGRRIQYRKSDLDAFLASRTVIP